MSFENLSGVFSRMDNLDTDQGLVAAAQARGVLRERREFFFFRSGVMDQGVSFASCPKEARWIIGALRHMDGDTEETDNGFYVASHYLRKQGKGFADLYAALQPARRLERTAIPETSSQTKGRTKPENAKGRKTKTPPKESKQHQRSAQGFLFLLMSANFFTVRHFFLGLGFFCPALWTLSESLYLMGRRVLRFILEQRLVRRGAFRSRFADQGRAQFACVVPVGTVMKTTNF